MLIRTSHSTETFKKMTRNKEQESDSFRLHSHLFHSLFNIEFPPPKSNTVICQVDPTNRHTIQDYLKYQNTFTNLPVHTKQSRF